MAILQLGFGGIVGLLGLLLALVSLDATRKGGPSVLGAIGWGAVGGAATLLGVLGLLAILARLGLIRRSPRRYNVVLLPLGGGLATMVLACLVGAIPAEELGHWLLFAGLVLGLVCPSLVAQAMYRDAAETARRIAPDRNPEELLDWRGAEASPDSFSQVLPTFRLDVRRSRLRARQLHRTWWGLAVTLAFLALLLGLRYGRGRSPAAGELGAALVFVAGAWINAGFGLREVTVDFRGRRAVRRWTLSGLCTVRRELHRIAPGELRIGTVPYEVVVYPEESWVEKIPKVGEIAGIIRDLRAWREAREAPALEWCRDEARPMVLWTSSDQEAMAALRDAIPREWLAQ